jgi:hypothetical protein
MLDISRLEDFELVRTWRLRACGRENSGCWACGHVVRCSLARRDQQTEHTRRGDDVTVPARGFESPRLHFFQFSLHPQPAVLGWHAGTERDLHVRNRCAIWAMYPPFSGVNIPSVLSARLPSTRKTARLLWTVRSCIALQDLARGGKAPAELTVGAHLLTVEADDRAQTPRRGLRLSIYSTGQAARVY